MRHTFPTFSACADPTVSYAYDLNDQEDGDCYGEMINELDKSIERSKHGYHHKNNKDDYKKVNTELADLKSHYARWLF